MFGERLAGNFGPPRHKFDLLDPAPAQMVFDERRDVAGKLVRPAPAGAFGLAAIVAAC